MGWNKTGRANAATGHESQSDQEREQGKKAARTVRLEGKHNYQGHYEAKLGAEAG